MFEFELPDLGEGVAEGEVLAWHVAVGDEVREDQVVAEVETDKAAVDVPSPVDGVVRERHADVGDVVATGEMLVSIEETETPAEPADETDGRATSRVFAPPSVRRLAREQGVDITAVDGSGPSGRITEADVEAAADGAATDDGPTSVVSKVDDDSDDEPISVVSKVSDDSDDEPTSVVTRVDDGEREPESDESRDGEPYVDAAAVGAVAGRRAADTASGVEQRSTDQSSGQRPRDSDGAASEGDRREPYRGVRRTTGERTARSRREVPHATHHDMVAVPGLVTARERLQPLAEERGVHLTETPLVVKCVAAALDEHPVLATQLDTDAEEIVYRSDRDLGVATATDHGLVVPVVEGVDEKGLLELAAELDDLAERARSRDLDDEAMQDGVFTVTNVGAIGGEYADPIINVPETAILGVGALKERPVVEDSDVVAQPTLTLSLAVDHRVIDGADAARFVETLKSYLSDPTRLLLD